MRKLTIASLKMLYRDKQSLFWAMAFPIIFTVVFGLFDFNQAPELRFGLVAGSRSPIVQGLEGGLSEVDSFEVERTSDPEAARGELEQGDLDIVVIVPPLSPSESATAELEVLYNDADAGNARFGLDAVESIVGRANLQMAGIDPPPMTMAATPVSGRTIEYYDFLLPGLVAMGVMNFAIIGMAIAVSRFREQRILKRVLATPLNPGTFLASQVIARLALSLVQAGLILAVGVYIFGANLYGNVIWIFVLALVANLIFLNFGFAVAGRAANPDAAQGQANAIALPMMFMSGVFFPIDTLPEIVQTIVRFLPLTPLIEAMRVVSLEGESITSVGSEMLLLGAWVIVSFVVARAYFRFSDSPKEPKGPSGSEKEDVLAAAPA